MIAEDEVGDFRAAARVSVDGERPPEPSDCVAAEAERGWSLRRDSWEWSFMRIERRVGSDSVSEEVGLLFDRVLLVGGRVLFEELRSDSDSVDMAEDELECFLIWLGRLVLPSLELGARDRFSASAVKGSLPCLPPHTHRPSLLTW